MKIFVTADLHGKRIKPSTEVDVVFVLGDFAKGDKLRRVVFGNERIEDAKLEILESSKEFLTNLPKGSIIISGNVEKLCIDKISEMALEEGHKFLDNKIIEIDGLKVLGLKFFMEEWWVRKTYPEDHDKIGRAKNEEREVREFLSLHPEADIILSHLPPYSLLDKDPHPPKILPKNYTGNCGSKALLEYIQNNEPKMVLCGHIHVPGEVTLGKTVVINPGEGRLISL